MLQTQVALTMPSVQKVTCLIGWATLAFAVPTDIDIAKSTTANFFNILSLPLALSFKLALEPYGRSSEPKMNGGRSRGPVSFENRPAVACPA